MNYEKEIELLLNKLPHKLQIKYALDCAESVFHLVKDKDKEVVRKALDTTALWLIDKASADEVDAAAATTAYADSAAVYSSPASPAFYAFYATFAASAASAASAVAAAKASGKDISYYYERLVSMIKDLTELDKLIYDLTDKELL